MSEITKLEFKEMYDCKLLELQDACGKEDQIELPLLHDFAPGVYARRIFMPADTFVIGKTHKTEHLNIVMSGSAWVMVDGEIRLVKGGYVFKSNAGCKKVLKILEDMVWMTVHPTEETDLEKLAVECVCNEEEEKKLMLEGSV